MMVEPILVAAVLPIRKVHFRQSVRERRRAELSKRAQNGAIGPSVIEHLIDQVAGVLREPGNFAVTRVPVAAAEQVVENRKKLEFIGHSIVGCC